MSGAATQRRLLALLSVLATAGDAGLSRDKLVALLWPDADAERARHSLTQALYSARRATGKDALFDATAASVRLHSSQISSDVRDFERLLDNGSLEEALALYRGPFLDGLFITNSQEFEQWSSAHRRRLRDRATQALRQLAAAAEARGDLAGSVRWSRQLVGLLPLDASSAVRLMTALAAAGDRAGAIKHARVHAALIREELGLGPDPAVEEVAARLRDGAASAVVRGSEAGEVTLRASPLPAIVPEPESRIDLPGGASAVGARAISSAPRDLRLPLGVRLAVLALVIATLVGAGVLLGRARREPTPELTPLALRQRVVVAPFRVAGADPSLAYLRHGMVELLATRLADDSLARSVDAGAVLGAWRAAGVAPAVDVPRGTLVKLATRLGAERVVVGSVVGTADRTELSATMLSLPGGEVRAEGSVVGPIDSLAVLVDRLAVRLLASQAGQEEELSRFVSRSLRSVRAYLAAQESYHGGDLEAALRGYATALRRDSTFALAALHEAIAADRLGVESSLRHGVALAWQSRSALGARDEAQLLALAGPRYPALSTGEELTAAWQRMVDLAPTSAESWFALALRLVHDGAAAGIEDAAPRALAALQRALANDSTHAPSRELLARLTKDDAGAGQIARSRETTPPTPRAGLRLRVLDGLYGGRDSAQANAAARTLASDLGRGPAVGVATSEGWLADACVLGQWRLHRGDTTRVAVTIARLREWDRRIVSTVAAPAPSACAALLEAWLAVTVRRRDARALVARLDSLAFTPQAAGDAAQYAPIVVARLFERIGDAAGARRARAKATPVLGERRYPTDASRPQAMPSGQGTPSATR